MERTFKVAFLVIIILTLMLLLLQAVTPVSASGTSVSVTCADYEASPPNYYLSMSTDVDVYVEFYEQWGNALAFGDFLLAGSDEWGFVSLDTNSGVRLRLWDEDFNIRAELTVDSNDNYPQCGEEGWRPPAALIPVEQPDYDCYWMFVQDQYGSWSIVADDANPDGILFHYGDPFFGAPEGQDLDPSHYATEETACPG